ncbi:YejL family protein [Enterovibrio nigricans]|uniref:UPF0352 protein SAMN02745132_01419 n=1 Tax=Enterovibrio nigricans DSM 22720 TaxID=1121868 RepID=A0A1T4UCZ8_9GAMM|nr:YejL family protein [Enterovibrio nigricans]PKF50992.1 hypothetical protein AT251_07470 [Enterovibrio nigricans]SKA50470.1 hypothetical protein SAMN02745132_01419 [Enterovibrio nigricans DSM 22720]
MPVTSKYQDKNVEQILSDVVNVLEKHKASNELSLMIVGNIATNLLNSSKMPAEQRKLIAEKFAQALLSSIDTE